MKIKIYGDGADINDMCKAYNADIVSGFTTNPTLLKQSNVTDYKSFIQKVVAAIPEAPISFEIFSDEFDAMEKEAVILSELGKNINVKIPISNTRGESSLPLIRKLLDKGLHINVTAILDWAQITELRDIAKPEDKIIVSIFAGRIADTGRDPIPTVKNAVELFKDFPHVEILWASVREIFNLVSADNAGAHIITIPYSILKKKEMFGKDLKELSRETVLMFFNDAKSSGLSL